MNAAAATHAPQPPYLDRLPRTVELIRSDESFPTLTPGTPVLVLLDQRRLPEEEHFLYLADWRKVITAIKQLAVRGAPAIGVAGAAALALWAAEYAAARSGVGGNFHDHSDPLHGALSIDGDEQLTPQPASPTAEASQHLDVFDLSHVADADQFDPEFYAISLGFAAKMVSEARPTAVNLSWGVSRMREAALARLREGAGPEAIAEALFRLVKTMEAEDEERNRRLGAFGAALLPPMARLLTHCNAGSLATVFYGTALGVIYHAAADGGVACVYADETRPVGQGARLTAWELARAGVPVTLISDSMAGSVLAAGKVDAVIVGADRIAANGDVANKIGTYPLAVLAHYHNLPFYVAAPSSTIDPDMPCGKAIPIEERDPAELLPTPLAGVEVFNPAFDVTPAKLITSIITEHGVFEPSHILDALHAHKHEGENSRKPSNTSSKI